MAEPNDAPQSPETSPEYFRIPLFGLEIERRTDVLALAAFSLAVLSASYQVLGFLRGADVHLFPPEQVVINFDDYGNAQAATRIHARMAYVNTGQAGYNAALSKETVGFQLGGRDFKQIWQAFQGFDSEGAELVPHYDSEAHPQAISAGSAVSHETYFAPHPSSCPRHQPDCDKWREMITRNRFIELLKGQDTLTFRFTAEFFGADDLETHCTVRVDDELFSLLAINGWAAPPCEIATKD